MGKHWVYIIKNEYDEEYTKYYVGETIRLYTRLNEHLTGRGGCNTSGFNNVTLVGLYNIINNANFINYHNNIILEKKYKWGEFEIDKWTFINWRNCLEDSTYNKRDYDYLQIENNITERCMLLFENTEDCCVSGGKYTKDNIYVDFKKINKDEVIDRPICKCGFPSEVFLSKKNEIWFKCAVANASWVDYDNPCFSVAEPCDFIQKYIEDKEFQEKYRDFETKQSSECVRKLPRLLNKLNEQTNPPCVLCKKEKYTPIFNAGLRPCCKICLVDRYDDIINYKPERKKYIFLDDKDE